MTGLDPSIIPWVFGLLAVGWFVFAAMMFWRGHQQSRQWREQTRRWQHESRVNQRVSELLKQEYEQLLTPEERHAGRRNVSTWQPCGRRPRQRSRLRGRPMDANSPLAFIVAVVAVQAVIWSVFGLLWHRRERRWQREDLVRRQLWDMEQQIREEGMSEEWRQWHQAYRQRQAEIQREARRRLGLPEEVDES